MDQQQTCGAAAHTPQTQFRRLQHCRNVTRGSVYFEINSSLATGVSIFFFIIRIEKFKTKTHSHVTGERLGVHVERGACRARSGSGRRRAHLGSHPDRLRRLRGEAKTKQNKTPCQKQNRKRKRKCSDEPEAGGKFSSPCWVLFFSPLRIWTLQFTLAKDVHRPVCTDEMRNFVIPTLPVFQNLLCLVVFLSAGVLAFGALPSERDAVWGLPRLPCPCCPPASLLRSLWSRFAGNKPSVATAGGHGDRIIDGQLSRPSSPRAPAPSHSVPLSQWLQIFGLKGTFCTS